MPDLSKSLKHPVSAWSLLPVVLLAGTLIGLAVAGNADTGVGLAVMGAAVVIGNVMARRLAGRSALKTSMASVPGPPGPLRIQEAIRTTSSPDVVWSMIEPPEAAPLLDPSIARGYRVPGTPDGLGGQQAFVRLDGTTSIVEVVELVPGRRAVVRSVSPPNPWHERVTWSVEPFAGGSILAFAIEVMPPPGHAVSPEWAARYEQQWREQATSMLTRAVRALSPDS